MDVRATERNYLFPRDYYDVLQTDSLLASALSRFPCNLCREKYPTWSGNCVSIITKSFIIIFSIVCILFSF